MRIEFMKDVFPSQRYVSSCVIVSGFQVQLGLLSAKVTYPKQPWQAAWCNQWDGWDDQRQLTHCGMENDSGGIRRSEAPTPV